MRANGLLWISLPWATFGAVVKNGVIVEVAPIGKWSLGKRASVLENWARKKKGSKVQWIS